MRCAAILAGGQARRFGGRDKSALVVDGRTILERQIAELSAVQGLAQLAIVGGAVTHPAARTLADLVPGLGPLSGLHAALTGLTARNDDAVFVVACDMPYVTRGFIARLFDELHDADAVVPQTVDGLHPLCAVYTGRCLEPLARCLAERRLKMKDLLADVRTRLVTPDDRRWLANVNTPGELAALHGHNEP